MTDKLKNLLSDDINTNVLEIVVATLQPIIYPLTSFI